MEFEMGLGIFIICIVISRVLSEKALKQLSLEEKGSLIDAFSGMRAYSLIPLAIVIGGYFLLIRYSNFPVRTLEIGYWGFLLIYIVVSFVITQSKLKKLNLPPTYLKQFGVSRIVQYLGLGIFLAVLIQDVI